MPRGGARARSGPAPDPDALRRERPSDKAGWTIIPNVVPTHDVPDWPLQGQSDREAQLWADMWRRPQSIQWKRLGQEYEVALFVRILARAEGPKASVELQKVVRQYLESLGLSVTGMLRNRWKLADPETEHPSEVEPVTKKTSARSRLKVVGE
ncbi:MAG: hypothetical protein IRZ03_08525 [Acidobacterium ailaaui]|nr:hypothetical protein [Pseudacidobacterium ailaaui]